MHACSGSSCSAATSGTPGVFASMSMSMSCQDLIIMNSTGGTVILGQFSQLSLFRFQHPVLDTQAFIRCFGQNITSKLDCSSQPKFFIQKARCYTTSTFSSGCFPSDNLWPPSEQTCCSVYKVLILVNSLWNTS